jgi:hypothetical protein
MRWKVFVGRIRAQATREAKGRLLTPPRHLLGLQVRLGRQCHLSRQLRAKEVLERLHHHLRGPLRVSRKRSLPQNAHRGISATIPNLRTLHISRPPLPQSPPRETSWVFQCCQRTRQLGLHRSLPLVQGSTSRSSRVEVPSCQPTYSHIPSCRPHTHTSIVTHVAASMLTHCHSVITHIVATTCFINCFCRSMEMQFRDGGWRVQSPVFLVLVVAGLFSLCVLHKVDCTIDVFGHYSN